MSLQSEPQRALPSPIVHEGHEYRVFSVAFSPDGRSVASGSYDRTIRIWDAYTPSPIRDPFSGHTDSVCSVSYSPLGDILASGAHDATVRLWDMNTGLQIGKALQADGEVNSVAFSPDANLIASGSDARTIQLWDVRNKRPASNPLEGHTALVDSVQFSPDGTLAVSGSWDSTIRLWDVEHRVTSVGPLQGHTDSVCSVAFSPDGSQIVSCSGDCTVRLWDARSREQIGRPYEGHTNGVFSAAFSPCGTYVASGAWDNTIRLWDIRTARQIDQSFEEHASRVWSVAFSPCGQYIASGSSDRRVIIRSIVDKVRDPDNCSEPPELLEDKGISHEPETTQTVTEYMSAQQIFESLVDTGCVDLSSQMDSGQDTAMIVSGGGFGDIWKGQLYSGTKVAIKAWRTNTMEECSYPTIKRAARELHYWSRMEHPNIHRLMGVIMFKEQYLGMVSEWMENGNLHEYLRKHPSVNCYQLCIDIASGLEYMHNQRAVHGDVKAANVLVSSDGTAKLSDFDFSIMSGVSNLVFTQSSNTRLGSIRWTAPEILCEEVRGRTTQSDVYALGMTMLEIFTRNVPYPERQMDFSVMNAVAQGILPTRPMDQLQGHQQGDAMWQLLRHCWNRNPSDRPLARQVIDVLRLLKSSSERE